MKKTSRKIISVILCVILCVSSVIPALAAGGLSIADIIKGAISSEVGGSTGSDASISDMISGLITGGGLGDINMKLSRLKPASTARKYLSAPTGLIPNSRS